MASLLVILCRRMIKLNLADRYNFLNINEILEEGHLDENPRPKLADGTPAHTLFVNHNFRSYDLNEGEFPITSLRPIAWKTGIKEILWIYQDQSNDLELLKSKYNVNYWDEWESKDLPGTIGARYGETVREYDLMHKLLEGLINDPYGRRHIIDLYQYADLNETDGLHPCAFCSIWNVRPDGENGGLFLDMVLVQRSGDYFMASGAGGINEVQYAALLMMVAKHCGYKPGRFSHFVANEHIYVNLISLTEEMLKRYEDLRSVPGWKDEPKPWLDFHPASDNFYDFTINDFTMRDYTPVKPQLKGEIAV